MAFPRMIRLRQRFESRALADVPGVTRAALAGLPLDRRLRPGQIVAVGVGSRGIANMAAIARAVVDEFRDRGGQPFVFPAMGSHGGGTAEGQLSVLEHYGITEATMGCPLRATMETVQVGEALGVPVYMDRYAHEADWIILCNRIKPHTDFKGSIESGLFKMMAIGLGKQRGAAQYHKANVHHGYETVILTVGRVVLSTGKLLCGVGIVEDGYDQTAKVTALGPEDLEEGEKALLREARAWMARLPFDPIDILIVDEMGKNISGSGLDSNVIGRPTNIYEPFPREPKITWIVTLDLTDASYGNAAGIGNVDFATRRLVEKIDRKATYINCLTAQAPTGAKIPMFFDSDREAIEAALNTLGLTPPEQARVVRIKNTLLLGEVEVSEAFMPEVATREDLTRLGEPRPMAFDAAGTLAPLS